MSRRHLHPPRPSPRGAVVLAAVLAAALSAGCSSPTAKPGAFAPAALAHRPLPADRLEPLDDREQIVRTGPEWLATDPRANLVFGRYVGDGVPRYCAVLECDPGSNRLALLPLDEGETPLSVLGSSHRAQQIRQAVADWPASVPAGALVLALDEVYRKRLLTSPLPNPRRILAVAFNFPSHLQVDLDIPSELHAEIRKTPPRLFWKYPPVPPPGTELDPEYPFRGVIGPFDALRYPLQVQLPADEAGESTLAPTNLDYEVEVGVVLGRTLTWEQVESATDRELRECIAGYVLVSDVKARNPQVYERALSRDDSPDAWSARYLTGDHATDLLLGNWDESTCAWWGYAASLGELVALGPWFVADGDADAFPPRVVLCARTYGDPQRRTEPMPDGCEPQLFHLRQCSLVTEDARHPEAMLWSVPSLLRAALDPKGALTFPGERKLEAGDVLALGTPGGIVLTVANRRLYDWLDFFLFWWDARDWHDAFFGRDQGMYLCDGDRVFLWAEGLGCQDLLVEAVSGEPVEPAPPAGRE